MDLGFHEHAVEVNRLESSADNLLRDSLAALFDEAGDPIEGIKWKEIYETMEIGTDRCEDVANVIEGIILKIAWARPARMLTLVVFIGIASLPFDFINGFPDP